MKLKPYPKYRPSGVEWLGDVPTHWGVAPFKWQIERNDGGVWGDDPVADEGTVVLRSTEQTVDGHWRIDEPAKRLLNETERTAALLRFGDLLVTKSSGSALHIGKTTIVDAEVAGLKSCYSNFMQRIRTRPSLLPRLAWYLMNNRLARLQFDLLSNSTTGLANLNGTMIGRLLLAVPPIEEQSDMVGFLDQETTKIDTLIAKQRKLIDLLQEKRRAVISHVVTKGLDSTVPMKPSGVEWLGDVPEHWQVMRLATLFREATESGSAELPVLSVSIHSGVSDRELDESEMDRMVARSEDRSKYKRVRPGDLVYNMMRAWQGGFGTVVVDGTVSPAYVVARPQTQLNTAYLELLLRTPQAVEQMRRYSQGVTDFRLRLYWDEFKGISVACPPLDEANDIMKFVDMEASKIDTLIAKAQQAIELQKEHRTALISATVTGKVDVRELVAQKVAEEKAA
ncbi:restriction endonuclease subunit S [Paraburkholderia sp. MM6662-R1]|uniref:restriction endonuclease subunit S n=1 Tax=Paraburkholderia sp. MM6662-R1 TaxID=2991066 RepID=UPI003D1EE806